jgi:hypothetical protein
MTNAYIKSSCLCALAGLSVIWTGMASAQEPPPATQVGAWAAVSDSHLDAIRGGFDLGGGLLASFGIDRVVYINGNLVSSLSVHIPDLARITPDQANALAAATGAVNVTQNGPGNTFNPVILSHATAATVIQNTLDNQHIQSLTTINTSVNSLNTFRNLNLQESLQAGLVGSLGH